MLLLALEANRIAGYLQKAEASCRGAAFNPSR
jgi:hypothetical protein